MSKAQAAETGNTDHGTASEVEKQPAPGVRRSHRKGKVNDGVDITDIKPLTEEETVGHDDNSEVSLSYISEEDEVDHERPEESSEENNSLNRALCQARYECKDCSKSFHHRNDLVRHMNIHNGTKPYTCEICGKTFLRSDYLRLHKIKHEGIKPLKCDLCERRFYDRSNLRQHMRTHTGEKPAMCPYCPHRCSQLSDMRKHLTTHTKEKAFQCDTCGKTFSLKTGLVAHQRLHTGERPFACEFCPKRFRDHTSMRRHKRIHTGDKPFLCTHCGKTFTQVANMKRHMLTHTTENKNRLYPCPFCGVELASKSDVRSHVAKDHEQKKDVQEAEGSGGKTTPAIKKDLDGVFPDKSVEVEAKHTCNLCGKVFPLDASLQEHVRSHLNSSTKEYQCETCGKTFCQSSSLKTHQLVHTGAKPHTCNVCQASFRKTHHLRRHYLVHTGERPYQCDFCERTFTSSGNLNKHRAIHLGEKNFECEFCPKKFTQSSNLSKHRAIHLRQQALAAEKSEQLADSPSSLQQPVASTSAKKPRNQKKKNTAEAKDMPKEAIQIPVTITDNNIVAQDVAGRTAVLHIVGTEETENDECQATEVSYVTISEGDIIIEI